VQSLPTDLSIMLISSWKHELARANVMVALIVINRDFKVISRLERVFGVMYFECSRLFEESSGKHATRRKAVMLIRLNVGFDLRSCTFRGAVGSHYKTSTWYRRGIARNPMASPTFSRFALKALMLISFG
jgi:hypothetical protein